MNLDLWREQLMDEEVKYWTKQVSHFYFMLTLMSVFHVTQHAQQALWRFGSQPILLLVAYSQWDHLPLDWNVDGLGWNEDIPHRKLNSAKILHWSGRGKTVRWQGSWYGMESLCPGKPWLATGLYRDLWTPYEPLECSGHGKCEEEREGERWVCRCEHNSSGLLCNE